MKLSVVKVFFLIITSSLFFSAFGNNLCPAGYECRNAIGFNSCPLGHDKFCPDYGYLICIKPLPVTSNSMSLLNEDFVLKMILTQNSSHNRIAHDGPVDYCGCHGDYAGRPHCH